MFLLVLVLLGPLLEEVFFRLPMKYSRNYLFRFFVYIVELFWFEDNEEKLHAFVIKTWRTYFWIFFYLMSSVFAFIHIFNHQDFKHLLLWSPLITMVQFVTGLIIGYLRLRFGFLWGWFYHGMYNLLVFSISMFLAYTVAHPWSKPETYKLYLPKIIIKEDKVIEVKTGKPDFKTYQVDNSEYTLSITKVNIYKDPCLGFGVTPSRIYFDNASVENILKTISYNHIKANDPDSMLLCVELKMKTQRKNADLVRDILKREMFKALSIK
jgi:hypothetical protein